ncbi:MAG: hypothetical protein ABIP93_06370 [Gemmatimonadaceae bacterium]
MAEARATGPTIALVSYVDLPGLTDDDRLLAAALDERGARVQPVVWSDPAIDWSSFDAVVVRSCWDYFLRADQFFAWLALLDAQAARVSNPVRTLRWNAEKTYLRDLETRGIPVVPTHWMASGAVES